MSFSAVSAPQPYFVIPLPFSIELYSHHLNKIPLVIFTATPDAGEDPKVTRAKFFIRDLFLVSSFILCFPTSLELYCSLQFAYHLPFHDLI